MPAFPYIRHIALPETNAPVSAGEKGSENRRLSMRRDELKMNNNNLRCERVSPMGESVVLLDDEHTDGTCLPSLSSVATPTVAF